MTVNEAAARLDMAVVSVRQAINRGALPATKRGREWDVAERDVEAYRSRRYATSAKARSS